MGCTQALQEDDSQTKSMKVDILFEKEWYRGEVKHCDESSSNQTSFKIPGNKKWITLNGSLKYNVSYEYYDSAFIKVLFAPSGSKVISHRKVLSLPRDYYSSPTIYYDQSTSNIILIINSIISVMNPIINNEQELGIIHQCGMYERYANKFIVPLKYGRLYIGEDYKSIPIYDIKTNKFIHFGHGQIKSKMQRFVCDLLVEFAGDNDMIDSLIEEGVKLRIFQSEIKEFPWGSNDKLIYLPILKRVYVFQPNYNSVSCKHLQDKNAEWNSINFRFNDCMFIGDGLIIPIEFLGRFYFVIIHPEGMKHTIFIMDIMDDHRIIQHEKVMDASMGKIDNGCYDRNRYNLYLIGNKGECVFLVNAVEILLGCRKVIAVIVNGYIKQILDFEIPTALKEIMCNYM